MGSDACGFKVSDLYVGVDAEELDAEELNARKGRCAVPGSPALGGFRDIVGVSRKQRWWW